MTRLIFILLALLSMVLHAHGQTANKETLLKRKAVTISKYDSGKLLPNQYLLKMDFGSSTITNSSQCKEHLSKQILRVELYFTHFQMSDSFEQSDLNSQRLDELQKLVPDIYKQTGIEWQFFGQNGAKTPKEAQSYFHGFVITYRDLPFIERSAEILLMECVSKELACIQDTVKAIECRDMTKTRKIWTGYYLPSNSKKRMKGKKYRNKGIWKREKEYTSFIKTTTICDTNWGVTGSLTDFTYISDTTVLQILDRKMKDWKNAVIVTDVTGSMYPYILQLQVWMRLNFHATDCRHFVFFNDGDEKPDVIKRRGKVGGIYGTYAGNYNAMEITCKEAMKNGGGGDGQENDIEAMLVAQKKFADCKEIILIADNFSPVRDMALLDKISKPVHVILCGTGSGFVNTEYLDIAYKTGGSLHTIEQDIDNMALLNDGAILEIMGQKFKLNKGKFELVKGV